MFRDVAFGQYYPAKSFVHRMDPVSYTHLTLPTNSLV